MQIPMEPTTGTYHYPFYGKHSKEDTQPVAPQSIAASNSLSFKKNANTLDVESNVRDGIHYESHVGMQPPLDIRCDITWNDFSSIANPLGTPPDFSSCVIKALESAELSFTPDVEAHQMRTTLARRFGLLPENFLCGTSVYDLIRAVAQTFQPSMVGVIAPSRHEYSLAASTAGHQVIDLTSPSSFVAPEPDLVRMYGMDFNAAILANPSYPSSRLLPLETLKKYLQNCTWVVVDERSIELTLDGESYIPLINEYPNLIIVRSLSESYAISGIPISYCVANVNTIAQVQQFYDPSAISMFTELLAEHLLCQRDYLQAARNVLETEIPWMQCMLNLVPGISIFPSEANYVMCEFVRDGSMDLKVAGVHELQKQLQLKGFLITPIKNIPGLTEDRYFCVSVKTRSENEALIKAIKSVILGY